MILKPIALIGSTFEECTFGFAWIRLSFLCNSGDRISLDTQHSLRCGKERLIASSVSLEIQDALPGIYGCLDSTVLSFDVSYENARLVFSSGSVLDLIRDESLEDNLFLLRNLESGQWAAVE